MQATGLPFHLLLVQRIDALEECTRNYHEQNTRIFDMLPDKLKDIILQNFQLNGIVPITVADIERLLNTKYSEAGNVLAILRQELGITPGNPNGNRSHENSTISQFNTFYWGGSLRMIPEDFTFPSTDLKTIFDLWFFGHCEKGIQPYRHLIKRRDELRTNLEKVNLSRASEVIKEVLNIASDNQLLVNISSNTWSRDVADRSFFHVFPLLISLLYREAPYRPEDIQYNTLYNRLLRLKRARNI